jgi:hypothetical protein
MRRFFLLNVSAAACFLVFWTAWVVFTVKVADVGSLRMLYWCSMLLCLLTFPVLSLSSFRNRPYRQQVVAMLGGLLLGLLVLYSGVILMIEVRVALAGGK